MKVQALAEAMRHFPQAEIQLQHHVINGIYTRTGMIPADTGITGCTHKTDHISILVGDATLTLDDSVERLTGYHVLPTKAGMTRAIYAHADTWMTTICKTDKTELADIENELIETPELLQTRNPVMAVSKKLLIGA